MNNSACDEFWLVSPCQKIPVQVTTVTRNYLEPTVFECVERQIIWDDRIKRFSGRYPYNSDYKIKDVIFNDPATIVFWADGTKTVVKTQGDELYDPEKGLTMAIAKKLYGNKGSYFNEIRKWIDKYERELTMKKIANIDEMHTWKGIDFSGFLGKAFHIPKHIVAPPNLELPLETESDE